ncbi:hypothetical protein [Nonomuraea sp. SYSU D8015]|uniref:hypothetical protein n=1 Tax=Nonomuraea sp. SYSU D8015 TaxID=2593644 RepID=UPI001661362D|nr:hypothetical protein [Nonomuraea sp. SYSU D8015]
MSASPFNYSTVSSPGTNAKNTATKSSQKWGFTTFKERREKRYREEVRRTRQQDFYDRRDYSVGKDIEKEQHIQRIRWDAARAHDAAKAQARSRERWAAFRDSEAQADISTVTGGRRAEFQHAQKLRHTGDFQSQRVSHEDAMNRTAQSHAATMGDINAEAVRKVGEAKAETAFNVSYSTTYGKGKGVADGAQMQGQVRADNIRMHAAADADASRTRATGIADADKIKARGKAASAKIGLTTADHEAEATRLRARGTADAERIKSRARIGAARDDVTAAGHQAEATLIRAQGTADAARKVGQGRADATRKIARGKLDAASAAPGIADHEAAAARIRAEGDARAAQIRAQGNVNARQIRATEPTITPGRRLGGALPAEPKPKATKVAAEPKPVTGGSTRSYGPLSSPKSAAVQPSPVNQQQIPAPTREPEPAAPKAPRPKSSRTRKPAVGAGQQALDVRPSTTPTKNPAPRGGTPVSQLHQRPVQTRQIGGTQRIDASGRSGVKASWSHQDTPDAKEYGTHVDALVPGIPRETRMAAAKTPGYRSPSVEEVETRSKRLGRSAD